MALGTLGVGKSHLMNTLAGSGNFKVGDSAESVTKGFSILNVGSMTLIDTPGLNDMDIPLL